MARAQCAVPFCGRTTGRAHDEWICGDHWKLVSHDTRRRIALHRRRFHKGGASETDKNRAHHFFWSYWDRAKREAIEAAAGIG